MRRAKLLSHVWLVLAMLLGGLAYAQGGEALKPVKLQPRQAKAAQKKAKPADRKKREEELRRRMQLRLRKQLGIQGDEEWEVIWNRIEAVQKFNDASGRLKQISRSFQWYAFRKRRAGRKVPKAWELFEKKLSGQGAEVAEVLAATKALAEMLAEKAVLHEEITEMLAAYHKAKDKFEEKRRKTQSELREILNARQEAALVLMGILD